ncbi:DUF1542 domain-containing protein [Corynebacterium mayonis]|uniref:DUF1542 domain-containing protein n=1 Tax=Corynebacterium mayonis TaxID=3062461 RepID=UPI0031406CD0
MTFLLLIAVVGGAMYLLSNRGEQTPRRQLSQIDFDDAMADAKRWTDRLGSQVLSLGGKDAASAQAMADASERFNAASAALAEARTVRQAELARESALEGLHYVKAAREIMGMPAGPELPELEGQRRAGRVTETRTVRQEDGSTITASPHPSESTPHYYPGGSVAGRPVPAGWYSSAWWAPAMMTGVWAASSMMFYSAMFAGMADTPAVDFGGDDGGGFDFDFGGFDF